MVLNRLQNIFLKPYPVSILKKQVLTGILIGLSISFILIIFQPFGTYEFNMNNKILFLFGYGIVFATVYSIYYLIIMTVLKKWFIPEKWTVVKEIITVIPVLLLISLASFFYYNGFIQNYKISLGNFGSFFLLCLAISVIPLSVLYYNKYLKGKLISVESSKVTKDGFTITIESNNKKEKPIIVESQELIYIKSCRNYIEVFTKNRKKPYIVRNSLNYIEGKLPKNEFLKAHRSYIVNIQALDSLILNGSNYTAKINGSDIFIPVSRLVVKDIRKIIG